MLLRRRAPSLSSSAAPSARAMATLAWKSLGFDFTPTKSMLIHNWKDGSWDGGKMQEGFDLKISALSNVLHYGQALFEGLKAFHCEDGKVRVFNSAANAQRLHNGCTRLHMPTVDLDMFNAAIDRVIKENVEYVPPYGSGGAMYLRPFLFGHGAAIGLGPAPEYGFCVVGVPGKQREEREKPPSSFSLFSFASLSLSLSPHI